MKERFEKYKNKLKTIPANNFVGTISVNVDNEKLTDKEFREFIRNTLPDVEFTKALK